MAILQSPGTSISVTDQSMYTSAGPGTVPLIFIATKENKLDPSGTAVAPGTVKARAGQLYSITSQRELLQTFGDPKFYNISGNPLNGYPLNEYGLLTAHSYLSISNLVRVVRADVDLAQLESTSIPPSSPAAVGTYWFDQSSSGSSYGLFRRSGTAPNQVWAPVSVSRVFNGAPDNTLGADGDHAVAFSSADSLITYWTRTNGQWIQLGANGSPTVLMNQVWPDLQVYPDEYWVRTGSSAQGANIVIRRMDATLAQFLQVECPILPDEAAANIYYDNNANKTRGQIFAKPVVDNSNGLETNALRLMMGRATDGVWIPMSGVIGSASVPRGGPVDGQLWFNGEIGINGSGQSTIDLLYNDGAGVWRNVNLPGFTIPTDSQAPTLYTQSTDPRDNVPTVTLSVNDIWVDTDQASYPVISVWSGAQWISVDNTDQTSNRGIIFSDARPGPLYRVSTSYQGINNGGATGGSPGPDLDPGVPDADLYPRGFMLWNTRYSTNNVKSWNSSFTAGGVAANPDNTNNGSLGRWVSVSGTNVAGEPYMGDRAQNVVIARAIQSVINNNEELEAEDIYFNLIAAPGYPEAIDEMLVLNTRRKETGFVVGDSPFTLPAQSTQLQAWANNSNLALENGPDGLITASKYCGVWYPAGLTTNVDGSEVVVPASHMALRTIAYNDQVAYPWFAPAGLQRGVVSNATSVGYVDATGKFVATRLSSGQNDTLYNGRVNPIRVMPDGGIVVFGQKTRQNYSSATDRINVVRLENYLRYNLDILARPFLFEPNDSTTRKSVKLAFDRFLSELVTLRGIYDFMVVVDETNNTPARIDRNELWVDLVVAPTKAIEFIYIPIRIVNTGTSLV